MFAGAPDLCRSCAYGLPVRSKISLKLRDNSDSDSINMDVKILDLAIRWGVDRVFEVNGPMWSRLQFLESIKNREATVSTGENNDSPDDTSVFGKPVYLKDMNLLELREYLVSGFSKEEQTSIFKT